MAIETKLPPTLNMHGLTGPGKLQGAKPAAERCLSVMSATSVCVHVHSITAAILKIKSVIYLPASRAVLLFAVNLCPPSQGAGTSARI